MRLTEKLLELCGCKIWPPTHDDPTVKGPQPRILSRCQREAIGNCKKEDEVDGVDGVLNDDNEKSKN